MLYIKKWLKENKGTVVFCLKAYLIWRVLLFLICFLGQLVLPVRTAYLGGGPDQYSLVPLLWSWANFDGVHYLAIAESGYGYLQQAFFPLYPIIIRNLAIMMEKNYLIAGLLVSNISVILMLIIFYRLIRLDYEDKIARFALLAILIFPTSFFLGAVYTESLFILLVLGAFYFARTNRWYMAGILGMLASATRVTGIFLFPALLVEWWQQTKTTNTKFQLSNLRNLFPVFIIPLGLTGYMWYLVEKYKDPLMFVHVQAAFGAGRTTQKLILLYQVFWRYLKMILTTRLDPLYFSVWLELLVGGLFLILLVYICLKRTRLSYCIFAISAYLLPTLTGTFLSLPRFALTLFPIFIVIGLWLRKSGKFRIVYLMAAIPLFIAAVIFFTRGYWVA